MGIRLFPIPYIIHDVKCFQIYFTTVAAGLDAPSANKPDLPKVGYVQVFFIYCAPKNRGVSYHFFWVFSWS